MSLMGAGSVWAGSDGGEDWWHKWVDENSTVELSCEGTGHYSRPQWQQFFGFAKTVARTEHAEWKVPGGVDLLRQILKRNPDMPALLAAFVRHIDPDLQHGEYLCTSAGRRPLLLSYALFDGYSITDVEE